MGCQKRLRDKALEYLEKMGVKVHLNWPLNHTMVIRLA